MLRFRVCTIACMLTGIGAIVMTSGASAQSSSTYGTGTMWGTVPGGVAVNGAYESGISHNQNSSVAGAVNAAKQGMLVGNGQNISIYSIGSQSIVSTTIIGNNNTSTTTATQTTTNTGTVTNTGTTNHR
jgi:hypothetical protein